MARAGLDAAMMCKVFAFGWEFFSVATFVGLILIAVNATAGDNLTPDLEVWNNYITMANVDSESHRMWAHMLSVRGVVAA